jgi:Na+/H+ antiporter NhaA
MYRKELVMVSLIASVGLTVALFVSDAAFDDEGLKSEAKMGALLSALNGIVALALGRCTTFEHDDIDVAIGELHR